MVHRNFAHQWDFDLPDFRLAGNYSSALPNSAGRKILIGIVWPTLQRLFGENRKVLLDIARERIE